MSAHLSKNLDCNLSFSPTSMGRGLCHLGRFCSKTRTRENKIV